jgi:hypothetical protein
MVQSCNISSWTAAGRLKSVSEHVHATVVPTPGPNRAEADCLLDSMEHATGLRPEPDGDGRRYEMEGTDPGVLTGRIMDALPPGWQGVLSFVL